MLPLSAPMIATLALFIGVGHCNDRMFADWHIWMADLIHKIASDIPLHAKTINIFGVKELQWHRNFIASGSNPFEFGKISQINGNDSLVFQIRDHLPITLELEWYDFLASVKKVPIFNSEDHIIEDEEVTALQNVEPEVGILFSYASRIYDIRYTNAMFMAYEGTLFAGTGVLFIADENVEKIHKLRILVISCASHIEEKTLAEIEIFAANGYSRTLDEAAENNVRVTVLISPQYYNGGMYPEMGEINSACGYDIQHKLTREYFDLYIKALNQGYSGFYYGKTTCGRKNTRQYSDYTGMYKHNRSGIVCNHQI